MSEFTGERVIPGQVEQDLWNEHVARYVFAARYATGKRVLDIGSGSGYGSAELSRTAQSVTGLDVSTEAVRYATSHFPLDNLKFTVGSAAAIPFPAASFDLVTAFEVIEHLNDWDRLIQEARRVLSADGLFIVSTPNRVYYAESRGAEGPNPYHVHEFEIAEFGAELSKVFPYVSMLLQNRSEAFVFYPCKTFWDIEARLDGTSGSPSDAHFLVAVCSPQPLTQLKSMVYVPRAVNLLRERELHIAKLQHDLSRALSSLAELQAAHTTQHHHLEEQNRWALGLEQELTDARERIVDLQNENDRKTQWGSNLNAEIEHLREERAEALRLLNAAQATVDERTRWALDLQDKLSRTELQLAGAKASRWVRTGRLFGIGPEL